jgi:tetratricopeptide (TPR) repeat protein
MTAINRRYLALVVGLAWVGVATCLQAQLGPASTPGQAAQARTQEELDVYLEIVSATDPRTVVQDANLLVTEFPKSELLGAGYQYQLQAFEQLNDFDGMLAAGQKALAADPDSLNTLLALAPAMANRAAGRPDRTQLLSQSEVYARRALNGIDKVRVPHELSIEQWYVRKHEMQSEAHGVLGVVAFQRGQFPAAISELEMAISLAPKPQGVQFLRLGLALASAGKKHEAEQTFRHAAELGPDSVRNVAADQLKKLTGDKNTLQ